MARSWSAETTTPCLKVLHGSDVVEVIEVVKLVGVLVARRLGKPRRLACTDIRLREQDRVKPNLWSDSEAPPPRDKPAVGEIDPGKAASECACGKPAPLGPSSKPAEVSDCGKPAMFGAMGKPASSRVPDEEAEEDKPAMIEASSQNSSSLIALKSLSPPSLADTEANAATSDPLTLESVS